MTDKTIDIGGRTFKLNFGFKCLEYYEEVHGIPLGQVNRTITGFVRYMHSAMIAAGENITWAELGELLQKEKSYEDVVKRFDKITDTHAVEKKGN